MDKEKFKKELQETIIYAARYASDFYNVKNKKNYSKLFSVDPREFMNKCYEGFKLAQDKIVENLLLIEGRLKIKKNELGTYEKGKHRGELKKDINYQNLKKEIRELETQKYCFHDIADVIVWTIMLQQKTHIRSFFRTGGGSGYLEDRDIDSSIQIAKDMNKKKDEFTLITDITSCLHVGDLVTVGNGVLKITELKQDTEINDLVSKIVHKGLDKLDVDMESMKELYKKSPKHGLGQLQRAMGQVISFFSAKEYIETDKTYDLNFKQEKVAVEILTKDVSYDHLIDIALDELKNTQKKFLILPFDSCVVGIFKKENYNSEFVCQMDFKHHLYHFLVEPYEKCQYLNITEDFKITEDKPLELFKYQDFEIHSLKEKLYVTGHQPLFLTLKEEHIIDLLTDKIAIYIYFDPDRFFDICKEKGLSPKWVKHDELKNDERKKFFNTLPTFNGKYLEIGKKDVSFIFGYGLLFKLIYDFQSAYSMASQMRENLWIMKHQKLSKIRDFIYFKIYFFNKLKIIFYYKKIIGKIKHFLNFK